MTSVANYIRRKPKDKLNILTFPTHQRYETELAKTGHNFYAANFDGINGQDYGLYNYHLMTKNHFYPRDGYDLILAQDRFYQFALANKINNAGLHVPIITLEHTVPTPDLNEQALSKMGSMVGDVNVFISNYSEKVWSEKGINRNNNVISHCVDSKKFSPGESREGDYVLTVANDFIKRDYCLGFSNWSEIKEKIDNLYVVGENAQLIDSTFKAASNTEELIMYYRQCKVYLNCTTYSTIPMSLLEAMSCGCPIVTTNTCAISEYIQDGKNGLIANTPEDAITCIQHLKNNPKLAKTLGNEARKTVLEKCKEDRFIDNWKELFMKTYEASL